ncbi:MAG: phosphate/phosphite/phosphonate ABC transporter substrate-binding protein [Gammaproteobacteria bacterium]|nr:phosphate/phosphite/phosphonate ABC transporter substrate-binding protein [Gammaproteobacteria bacterium]
MLRLLILSVVLFCPSYPILAEKNAAGASTATLHAAKTYVFSVVPQYPVNVLYKDWSPLLEELGKQTGFKFKLQLADSIPEFERDLLLGNYDFAYANPFHTVMAHKSQSYRPIIRDNSSRLKGILVVRKDSKIHTVQQLQDSSIAFPSPNAFASSLFMKTQLINKEKISFQTRYAESHTNTIRYVLLGKSIAGSVVSRTLEKQRPEAKNNLRTIYQTPEILPHPILAYPSVDTEAAQRFQQGILELSKTAKGQQLLENVHMQIPVISSYAEYKNLESLKLNYSLQIHQYQGGQ